MLMPSDRPSRSCASLRDAKENTMIGIRHLDAAPDDIEKDFDVALIRTHALTLTSEALREAQVDLAHVERITTIRQLTASGATSLNSSSRFASDGNSGFQVLWEDGERVFCRGNSHGDDTTLVLAVLPASEHPAPAVLDRLAHEYELTDELDPAWAARPLQLVQTDANLFSLVICRAVNLSLEGGNCDGSCFAYVRLGMVAGPRFGDYHAGFRFGRLGHDLVEQHGLTRFQARTYMSFGSFVLPWTRHVRAGRDFLHRALQAANKMGDLNCAAYSGGHLATNLLAAGSPLVDVQRETENALAFAQKTRFGFVIDITATQLGLIRTLRGLTPKFGSFDDEQFDEIGIERRFARSPHLAHASRYWIRKLQARFFAGEYAAAVEASSRAQSLLWTVFSHFETAEYDFYGALSRAASCDSAPAGERRQHQEALAAHHKQLQAWADNCPDNFENRAALVGAEIARLEGRELDAERLYEQAIG